VRQEAGRLPAQDGARSGARVRHDLLRRPADGQTARRPDGQTARRPTCSGTTTSPSPSPTPGGGRSCASCRAQRQKLARPSSPCRLPTPRTPVQAAACSCIRACPSAGTCARRVGRVCSAIILLPAPSCAWEDNDVGSGRALRRSRGPVGRASSEHPRGCSPGGVSISSGRARLPRLRPQRLARPQSVRVYVRSPRRDHEPLHRSARASALHPLHAGLRRPGGLSHGAGSSGADRGARRPGRVAHNEGLGANWVPRRFRLRARMASPHTVRPVRAPSTIAWRR
jgi:hypothetical protein